LRGDAWTWWTGAAGQFDRGQTPRLGAVVVFKRHGAMSHGHVAVVADMISARRLLVDHANWAPNRGRERGRVTTLVAVTDVSPHNDWSLVRVWNDASGELGSRIYPTYGFIYPRAGSAGAGITDESSAEIVPAAGLAGDESAALGENPGARNGLTASALASLGDLLTPPALAGGLAGAPSLAQ